MKRLLWGLMLCAGGCSAEDDGENGDGSTDHAEPWSYAGAGPDEWGDLPGYEQCREGRRQSPIALRSDLTREDLPDLKLDYADSHVAITNTGHTIEYAYAPGSMLRIGDKSYALVQFHFHAESEHTLDGRRHPIELHLVHRAEDGTLAVLGVFLAPGDENQTLRDAGWERLPQRKAQTYVDEQLRFNALDLVPGGDSYRYAGSLTTPPCSESVSWVVFDRPLALSEQQIDAFTMLHDGNLRPVQASEERPVLFGQ